MEVSDEATVEADEATAEADDATIEADEATSEADEATAEALTDADCSTLAAMEHWGYTTDHPFQKTKAKNVLY